MESLIIDTSKSLAETEATTSGGIIVPKGIEDSIERNEVNANAMGGSELMARALKEKLDNELLDNFQIITSRVRQLDEDKIPVLWLHDLPEDPESHHLAHSGWQPYNIVYVSHWQKQRYIDYYDIPYSKGVVIQNAVEVDIKEIITKPDKNECLNIIYHTTPHRGLGLLVPVYDYIYNQLKDNNIKIHLDVFSSFEIYGWPERDKPFENLFDMCKKHEGITYHGFQPHEKVLEKLKTTHIFAYPSVWQETSCLALLEAMAAECICVHPDLAALPETAANLTYMYNFHEDPQYHANVFAKSLMDVINLYLSGEQLERKAKYTANYIKGNYDWNIRAKQWEIYLQSVLNNSQQNDSANN